MMFRFVVRSVEGGYYRLIFHLAVQCIITFNSFTTIISGNIFMISFIV